MSRDPKSIEVDGPVCGLLLERIGRPKNLIMCKASNLWDNRYRINVYTRYMVDPETELEGNKIIYSCFAKLIDDNKLEVIQETKGLVL